jgi:alpha-glucosidase
LWQHNGFDSIPQEFYQRPLWTAAAKHAIDYRYRMLDYLYTAMWQQNQTGDPVISPLYFTYPTDANTFPIDLQFFFGDSVLVSPVTEENSTSVDFYLPRDIFYDFFTLKTVQGKGAMVHRKNVGFTEIPVHIKGGSILPLRTHSANTTTELRKQNFTIVVAPGKDGKAKGQLYLDDGDSLVQKSTSHIHFDYSGRTFNMAGKFDYDAGVAIDAVKILGVTKAPKKMAHGVKYDAKSQVLQVNIGKPLKGPLRFTV